MRSKYNKVIFNKSYPSSREKRKEIIEFIITKLKSEEIKTRINNNELYLIIDEALTNALEHGNSWDEKKKVKILIQRDNEHLDISIEDEGKGFDPEEINRNFTKLKKLEPRGRGIFIITNFSKVKWNERGNLINLKIDLVK